MAQIPLRLIFRGTVEVSLRELPQWQNVYRTVQTFGVRFTFIYF